MSNILHVIMDSPTEIASGGVQRTSMITNGLSQQGDVTTISYMDWLHSHNDGLQVTESGLLAVIRDDFIEMLLKVMTDTAYETIVIDSLGLGALIPTFRSHCPLAKIVLSTHNIDSEVNRELKLANYPKFLRGLIRRRYQKRFDIALAKEAAIFKSVDTIWVCSIDDESLARQMTDNKIPISVLRNPVPNWALAKSDIDIPPRSGHFTGLFVGYLLYRPNIIAIRYILRKLHSILIREIPSIQLQIVGRGANDRMRKLISGYPNVELASDVPKLEPYYEAADFVLLPIFHGGGTRLKVLEALAVGVPIIATAKAVEGLSLRPNTEYLHAESPTEFVLQIERLRTEHGLSEQLSHAGKALIREQYSAESYQKEMQQALTILSE